MGFGMAINRNMVALRNNGELTLVNPVRLSPEGEAELESLGAVRHAVRLGYHHGMDDAYYVERYSAEFLCQPGSDHHPNPQPDRLLTKDAELPFPDGELFLFEKTKFPEAAILLRKHGGVLLTCDSLQHWADWNFCTWQARLVMRMFGFSLTTLIGTFWLKSMTPKGGSLEEDFRRLLELDFRHLVSAHGALCRDRAREGVKRAVAKVYG